jgi:hypothetical protein
MGKVNNGDSSSSAGNDPGKKRTWERRLDAAKHKHRSKLKDWAKDKFGDRSPSGRYKDFLSLRDGLNQIRNISRPDHAVMRELTEIDRISCHNLSSQGFIDYYERPEIPCIISGIPSAERWPAMEKWKLDNHALFKHRLGDRLFKVGEDDDGYKVKVRMKYFLKYLRQNNDDSPLYVFDGNYDNDSVSKSILHDYRPPRYFPDDLFELVGESRRPPYRYELNW